MKSFSTVAVVAVVALVAAGAALATDSGILLWRALLSIGVLRGTGCPDVVTAGGAGLCARPTSLVLTIVATAVLAGLLGGAVGHFMLRRRAHGRRSAS